MKALLLIDIQNGFCPGGNLAVADGDKIVPIANALIDNGGYDLIVASQDWHPENHGSFASQHPGKKPFDMGELSGKPQMMWPDHCVQGTPGAALSAGVDWTPADLILRKGTRPQVDSYSAFRENHGPDGTRPTTGLAGWLHARGIEEVHVCGLARDYCVLWSAQDAAAAGFRVRFLWHLTQPVTPSGDAPTRAALDAAGIAIEYA